MCVVGVILWFKDAKHGLLFMAIGNLLMALSSLIVGNISGSIFNGGVAIFCFYMYWQTPPNHQENCWKK